MESASEAEKHFETRLAQKALDDLITLVTEAAMETSVCYEHSKLSEYLGFICVFAVLIDPSGDCHGDLFIE